MCQVELTKEQIEETHSATVAPETKEMIIQEEAIMGETTLTHTEKETMERKTALHDTII